MNDNDPTKRRHDRLRLTVAEPEQNEQKLSFGGLLVPFSQILVVVVSFFVPVIGMRMMSLIAEGETTRIYVPRSKLGSQGDTYHSIQSEFMGIYKSPRKSHGCKSKLWHRYPKRVVS